MNASFANEVRRESNAKSIIKSNLFAYHFAN